MTKKKNQQGRQKKMKLSRKDKSTKQQQPPTQVIPQLRTFGGTSGGYVDIYSNIGNNPGIIIDEPKKLDDVIKNQQPIQPTKGAVMGYKYKTGDKVMLNPESKLFKKYKQLGFDDGVIYIDGISNNFYQDGNYCYQVERSGKTFNFRSDDLIPVISIEEGDEVIFLAGRGNLKAGTEGVVKNIDYKNKQYIISVTAKNKDIEVKIKESELPILDACFKKKTTKASPKQVFDSIVLPDDHIHAIKEAIAQNKPGVYDKIYNIWGFGEVLEKGKGCHMLFYGPPGTGKTLAGEAIAKMLKKELRIIQTAEVQSSEPGGCERAIKMFFQQAKNNNWVLLFDECDSLIYDRSVVGMIIGAEINCLLSEMERHEGVCIFTTNNAPVLDAAFERRLSLKLEFQMPDKDARLKIWKRFFPKDNVLDESVDLAYFAKYVISGGTIKNIVLNAARRAAYLSKNKIEHEDLEYALKREEAGQTAFAVKRNVPKFQGYQTGAGRDIQKDIEKKGGQYDS